MIRIISLAVCLGVAAYATTFATHVGDTSPAAEGFTADTASTGIFSQNGIADDLGFPAYRINGNYNFGGYGRAIPLQIRLESLAVGWKLTVRMRVGSTTNSDGGSVAIALGGKRWDINMRNTGGDTTFRPNAFAATPSYVDRGSAGKYALCELIYNPATRAADLYVNGEKRITGFEGHTTFAGSDFVGFGPGAGFGENGTAHFHFVRFEYGPNLASINAAGFASAASYAAGGVAPGEIITLGGLNLGPTPLATATVAGNAFPTSLSGTRVLFDETPAPVIYVSDRAASVIVPYSVGGKNTVQLAVERAGQLSAPLPVKVLASKPALFSANSSGTGPGAILNQDNTLNSPSSPAEAGSIVILFGTGEGQTSPAGRDGILAMTTPLPAPVLPVRVQFDGGSPAEILYAGAAPGAVAGLFQINVRLPAGLRSGNVPVVVTVGSASSQAGLTVAVR